jgi:hypothetical protein
MTPPPPPAGGDTSGRHLVNKFDMGKKKIRKNVSYTGKIYAQRKKAMRLFLRCKYLLFCRCPWLGGKRYFRGGRGMISGPLGRPDINVWGKSVPSI